MCVQTWHKSVAPSYHCKAVDLSIPIYFLPLSPWVPTIGSRYHNNLGHLCAWWTSCTTFQFLDNKRVVTGNFIGHLIIILGVLKQDSVVNVVEFNHTLTQTFILTLSLVFVVTPLDIILIFSVIYIIICTSEPLHNWLFLIYCIVWCITAVSLWSSYPQEICNPGIHWIQNLLHHYHLFVWMLNCPPVWMWPIFLLIISLWLWLWHLPYWTLGIYIVIIIACPYLFIFFTSWALMELLAFLTTLAAVYFVIFTLPLSLLV